MRRWAEHQKQNVVRPIGTHDAHVRSVKRLSISDGDARRSQRVPGVQARLELES
jgi:sirohydrochlorin ferrochelatase